MTKKECMDKLNEIVNNSATRYALKSYIDKKGLNCEADIDAQIKDVNEIGKAVRREVTWSGMVSPFCTLTGGTYNSHQIANLVADYLLTGWDQDSERLYDYLSKLSDDIKTDGHWTTVKFSSETIAKIDEYLAEYKAVLEDYRPVIQQREARRDAEKVRRGEVKANFSVGAVYKDIKPHGGEYGTDGYFDADYINSTTGDITRMVERDVFDFGCYSYPKRVEGTQDVLNCENWTDEELAVNKWICKFGKFKGIRM